MEIIVQKFQNRSQHMTKLVTSNFITKVQNFENFDKIPVDLTRAYDVECHPNTYKMKS